MDKPDDTRLAGQAFQSNVSSDATRIVQSMMLAENVAYQSRLAVLPEQEVAERYAIGDKIGDRYEVLAIHKGSMGIIYATFNHKENLPQALKFLQQRFARNKNMMDLFIAEASTWIK